MTKTFVFNCIAKKAYYSQPNEIFFNNDVLRLMTDTYIYGL